MEKVYGVNRGPDYVTIKRLPMCIPQYKPGHIEKMYNLVQTLNQNCPRFRMTGNFIDGSGIPHLFNYAKREVNALKAYTHQQQQSNEK